MVALEKVYRGTGLARVVVGVAADVRRAQAQEDEGWGDLEKASEVSGENPRVGSRRARENSETSSGEEESERKRCRGGDENQTWMGPRSWEGRGGRIVRATHCRLVGRCRLR